MKHDLLVNVPSLTRGALIGVIVLLPSAAFAQGNNAGPAAKGPASVEPEIATNDRFAVVNANGTLARDFGAVSVTHTPGSGSYIVNFNKNVRRCAYTATIGLGGAVGTSARGFITAVGAAVNVKSVFVTTDSIAGTPAERGFHLLVSCP